MTSRQTQTTYRIGEAAALLNLKTYVLRFWEMEFPQIAPVRTEKGQRLYREEDIALLRRIRYLLHERGLTIDGARRILAEKGRQEGTRDAPPLGAGAEPDAAPDEDLDALDEVLSAECRRQAGEEPRLSLPLAREYIAELEAIRRLLADGGAHDPESS